MMQDNARKITYGAMMIALFALLMALTLYVPLIGTVTLFFIPLPILLYRLKYDRAASLLVLFASAIVSSVMGGVLSIPFALILGLLGLVMGDTMQSGKTKLYTVMATGIALLISMVISYIVAIFLFSFNAIDDLMKTMTEMQDQMLSMMTRFGKPPEGFEELLMAQFDFYQSVIPSMFMMAVLTMAFLFVMLNSLIIQRLGYSTQKFPPFHEMKLPMITVVLYGVILLVSFIDNPAPGTNMYLLLINATIILRTLFLLQGIAFLHFYITEMKFPTVVKVFATIIALMISPMTTLLGILDSGMNIRAWIRKDKAR